MNYCRNNSRKTRRSRRTAIRASWFAAIVALLLPAEAIAAVELLDQFAIRVGGFATRFDTEIRRDDPDGGRGTDIDFDKELGLEDRQVIEFIGADWRPWKRHEFGLNFFREEYRGTRRLNRDIVFGEETFALDSTVRSELALQAFEFHYTYWPIARETWALGFRVGYMDFRLHTAIELLLGIDGEAPSMVAETEVTEYIPAPSFGVDLRAMATPRWRVSAHVGWFEAKFKNISPVVATARIGLEYLPWENLGLWADYGLHYLDADVHTSRFDGALRIYQGGLRLGVTWRI